MGIKKAQFAVFDVLLMMFFVTSTIYFISDQKTPIYVPDSNSYEESILLSHLINQPEFVNLIFLEDISLSNTSQNWTFIEKQTRISLNNIYLKIANNSEEEIIFSCNSFKNLEITQDIVINSSTLELRVIDMGVCT